MLVEIKVVPNRVALSWIKALRQACFVFSTWDEDLEPVLGRVFRNLPPVLKEKIFVVRFPDTERPDLAHLFDGVVFNEELAERIAEFLLFHLKEDERNFVFSCDAGISRSAALATAFAEALEREGFEVRLFHLLKPSPNGLVKSIFGKILSKAFGHCLWA